MKRAIIIGAGQGGTALFHMLISMEYIDVVAIFDHNPHAPGLELAKRQKIKSGIDWTIMKDDDIDFVFEVTGDPVVLQKLRQIFDTNTTIVPSQLARLFFSLMKEKDQLILQLNKQTSIQELILNSTHDGMIAIDNQERVLIYNEAAAKVSAVDSSEAIGRLISEVLPSSGLPRVLRTKKVEHHRRQQLENGATIVTTRGTND